MHYHYRGSPPPVAATSRALFVGAVTMLFSMSTPRDALAALIRMPYIPDPVTAADSARGSALAVCTQGNRLDAPAHFTVIRRLGGMLPDSFTAYPRTDGYREDAQFRAGWHYALLLRPAAAPIGPEFRRVFKWRPMAEYEVWHSDPAASPQRTGFPDSLAARLYTSIWELSRLQRAARAETIAVWLRSNTPARSWGFAAVQRHPDLLAGGAVRGYYLDELEHAKDLYRREYLASSLARYPDSSSRVMIAAFARGDSTGPEVAVWLGAHDRTAWVRQLILSIVDKTLAATPGPAPDMLDPREPAIDRWAVTLARLRALTEALEPDSSSAERAALIRIAQWARPRHWVRYAALRSLAHDSSPEVRALIWQTVEGDSASRSFGIEDGPEPTEVTPYWTTDDLHRALRDTSSILRSYAYREVGRRRDLAGADTILTWLRVNRVPGREDIPLGEAELMIETLGDAGCTAAVGDLLEWGKISDRHLQVMDALATLGDRRAATYFRSLAKVPCAKIPYFAKRSLAQGLAAMGDQSDVELMEQWAVDCPDDRDVALEAIGVLGGVPRMVAVIRRLEQGPPKPEQARDYELIEARVRSHSQTGGLHAN